VNGEWCELLRVRLFDQLAPRFVPQSQFRDQPRQATAGLRQHILPAPSGLVAFIVRYGHFFSFL
jgi:hypothetical protein